MYLLFPTQFVVWRPITVDSSAGVNLQIISHIHRALMMAMSAVHLDRNVGMAASKVEQYWEASSKQHRSRDVKHEQHIYNKGFKLAKSR